MLESCDSYENSFTDLTANLHLDEDTSPIPDTIEAQCHGSLQLRPTIPMNCHFQLEELDESRAFFNEGFHYENDLVCLGGNSNNYAEHSTNLDYAEKIANFNVEEYSGSECYSLRCAEYCPTSSISSIAEEGESCYDESCCAEMAKELGNDAEILEHANAENHFATKGKVNDLQRSALDAIFQITDRPSRVLVIYIASELRLHHVTVKNFFSNARRRVRRAAARLTDPERSKRENRKRKEKRRLAALSLAAGSRAGALGHSEENINQNLEPSPSSNTSVFQQYRVSNCDEGHVKSAELVSPKRKALMEKLVDKVQRSAAQKIMGSVSDSRPRTPDKTDQISLLAVHSDSSENWQTDASFSNFSLPLSLTPRSSEDVFANIFPLNVDSCSDLLHQSAHATDVACAVGQSAPQESLSCDRVKNDDLSAPWRNSLLNIALEYQPESWNVSSLL